MKELAPFIVLQLLYSLFLLIGTYAFKKERKRKEKTKILLHQGGKLVPWFPPGEMF